MDFKSNFPNTGHHSSFKMIEEISCFATATLCNCPHSPNTFLNKEIRNGLHARHAHKQINAYGQTRLCKCAVFIKGLTVGF